MGRGYSTPELYVRDGLAFGAGMGSLQAVQAADTVCERRPAVKKTRMSLRAVSGVLSALLAAACLAEDKPAKEPAKLVIVKALYGDLPDGAKTDVTEKVKGMAKPEGLTVDATNDNFGDPAEGVLKKLKVEYTLDGQKLEMTVNENETLSISTKPVKLKILKALYGDLPDGNKTDVTAKVQAMVKDDAVAVDATNDNFGDPADGIGKKLKVEYSFDGGATKSKEVAENETLAISNKGE